MSTPNKLLSTKGQDKMPTLKGAEKPKDAGGPEPFDPSIYADFKFDAVAGVKADTTVPKAVKGEPMDKIDAEEDKIEEPKLASKKPAAVGQHAHVAKLPLKEGDEEAEDAPKLFGDAEEDEDEDDGLAVDAEGDVPADEAAADGDVPAEDEGDDILDLLNIRDLIGDDETSVELGAPEVEPEPELSAGEPALGDEPVAAPVDGEVPSEAPVDEPIEGEDDLSDDEFPEIGIEGEDDVPADEAPIDGEEVPAEGEPVDGDEAPVEEDKTGGCSCGCPNCGGAAEDEDPIVEGVLKINFNLDKGDLLIESNDRLTDEEKAQAVRLFEAAVRTATSSVSKTLHKAYGKKAKALIAERVQAETKLHLGELSRYLDYVVEEWLKANKVPVRGQLQAKLAENLMRGLKRTFEENYIDMPESKIDVVETLTRNVKTLRKQLRESEQKNVKLNEQAQSELKATRQTLVVEHKARIIAEAAAKLPAVDRTAFKKAANAVTFSNTKNFKKDVEVLREQYSGADTTKAKATAPTRRNVPDAEPLFETRKSRTDMDAVLEAADKMAGR